MLKFRVEFQVVATHRQSVDTPPYLVSPLIETLQRTLEADERMQELRREMDVILCGHLKNLREGLLDTIPERKRGSER